MKALIALHAKISLIFLWKKHFICSHVTIFCAMTVIISIITIYSRTKILFMLTALFANSRKTWMRIIKINWNLYMMIFWKSKLKKLKNLKSKMKNSKIINILDAKFTLRCLLSISAVFAKILFVCSVLRNIKHITSLLKITTAIRYRNIQNYLWKNLKI